MENSVTLPLLDLILILTLSLILGILIAIFTAAAFKLRRITTKLKKVSK